MLALKAYPKRWSFCPDNIDETVVSAAGCHGREKPIFSHLAYFVSADSYRV
jgi:hypothetical protein